MIKQFRIAAILVFAGILSIQGAIAGEKPFAKTVPALDGAPPEGFTIGRGKTAYNGSIDGSIYKVDLRSGKGSILVDAEPGFDINSDCYKLGMRVDPRTNYLFVAGCINGDAYVIDANTGDEIMKYQFSQQYASVINDLAITNDAAYFTDSAQPFIYRLPLDNNGGLPAGEDAATALSLSGEFVNGNEPFCCAANGIVATPNGKTLIVGHSNHSKLYNVDPDSGHSVEIIVSPALSGFLDGIVMYDNLLYIMTPDFSGTYPPVDKIQVVALDENMLTGSLLGSITDPDMDGVASGAMHGDSLYVNNARYFDFPGLPTQYWLTKINIYDVQ